MAEKNELAERIRRLRADRTQIEISEMAGLEQGQWSKFESGSANPSVEALIRIGALAAQQSVDDAEFFWEQTGIDPSLLFSLTNVFVRANQELASDLFSTLDALRKERLVDAKVKEDEGKVVLVPPFTKGEWKRQECLQPEPFPAAHLPNKMASFYLITTTWGHGFAPRDRIFFDTYETSAPKWGEFLGEVVLAMLGPAILSIGRLDRLERHKATYLLYAHRDRQVSSWSPHEMKVVDSVPTSSTLQSMHSHGRSREAELSSHREEYIYRAIPSSFKIVGRFRGLIPADLPEKWEEWNPETGETFEAWLDRR
ncbi:MAG TPA: helix-turn-helix transcriptional regulator [Terriglobia bacterium]|nr:helix-turn-helix transcriptional regulator [Terriglobia bacterium]